MRKRLREGTLDDKEIELDLAEARPTLEILGAQGMPALKSSFYPLDRSADIFNWDPV